MTIIFIMKTDTYFTKIASSMVIVLGFFERTIKCYKDTVIENILDKDVIDGSEVIIYYPYKNGTRSIDSQAGVDSVTGSLVFQVLFDLSELLKTYYINGDRRHDLIIIFKIDTLSEMLSLIYMIADSNSKALNVQSTISIVLFRTLDGTTQDDFCEVILRSQVFNESEIVWSTNFYIFVTFENIALHSKPKYFLFELYFIKRVFCQQVNLSILESYSGISLYSLLLKVNRRKNLQGIPIVASGIDEDAHGFYVQFKENTSHSNPKFSGGSSVEILRIIRDASNFTEKSAIATWDDLWDSVRDGQIDIAISETSIKLSRRLKGTFLQPTDTNGMKAYFVQPSSNDLRVIYWIAFDKWLWFSIAGSCGLIVIVVKIFAFIKRKMRKVNRNDEAVSDNSILWTVAVATQHGWYVTPSSVPMRIISLISAGKWMLCFIAYSAAIVSLLSVDIVQIKSFNDLIRNEFNLFVDEYADVNFTVAGLDDKYMLGKVAQPLEIILPELLKGKSFVISWPDVFYNYSRTKFSENDACSTFSEFSLLKKFHANGMFMRNGSPLVEIFNHEIMIIKEAGFIARRMANYKRNFYVSCVDLDANVPTSFKPTSVQIVFLILFCGYGFSMFTIFAETLFRHYQFKKELNAFRDKISKM